MALALTAIGLALLCTAFAWVLCRAAGKAWKDSDEQ